MGYWARMLMAGCAEIRPVTRLAPATVHARRDAVPATPEVVCVVTRRSFLMAGRAEGIGVAHLASIFVWHILL